MSTEHGAHVTHAQGPLSPQSINNLAHRSVTVGASCASSIETANLPCVSVSSVRLSWLSIVPSPAQSIRRVLILFYDRSTVCQQHSPPSTKHKSKKCLTNFIVSPAHTHSLTTDFVVWTIFTIDFNVFESVRTRLPRRIVTSLHSNVTVFADGNMF